MAQSFLGCDRDQVFLLPPSVDDWLPADHFARFVIAAVEEMDLTRFTPTTARTVTAGRRTIRR